MIAIASASFFVSQLRSGDNFRVSGIHNFHGRRQQFIRRARAGARRHGLFTLHPRAADADGRQRKLERPFYFSWKKSVTTTDEQSVGRADQTDGRQPPHRTTARRTDEGGVCGPSLSVVWHQVQRPLFIRRASGDVDGHLCSDLFQGKEETRKREDGMLDGKRRGRKGGEGGGRNNLALPSPLISSSSPFSPPLSNLSDHRRACRLLRFTCPAVLFLFFFVVCHVGLF